MTSKGKILVVDDDRLVLATLTHGLVQAGYEVIDADNGDDAILLAREHRPELALLDIRMEGMSGFDVAAYLREALQTPFMFLSAFADEDTVSKVKELGAVAYLVKPLDIHQIVPAVEAAFANQRSRAKPAGPSAPRPASLPAAGSASELSPSRAAPGFARSTPASTLREAPDEVLHQSTAMAVGVLMHRYSLSRRDALARLHRMAAHEGRTPHEQALRLLEAVELLALPATDQA